MCEICFSKNSSKLAGAVVVVTMQILPFSFLQITVFQCIFRISYSDLQLQLTFIITIIVYLINNLLRRLNLTRFLPIGFLITLDNFPEVVIMFFGVFILTTNLKILSQTGNNLIIILIRPPLSRCQIIFPILSVPALILDILRSIFEQKDLRVRRKQLEDSTLINILLDDAEHGRVRKA